MQVFLVWLIVRILTSLTAILASPLRKLTELERTIPVWPPSIPTFSWLSRLFFAPLERWDVHWYIKIVSEGYSSLNGTAQFHPLFPWIAKGLYQLGINPLSSLLLVSSIASILLFFAFYLLVKEEMASKEDTLFALVFFALSPLAFVLFLPYPEGLFLLCAVMSLYWAIHRKWWLASLAGALAVLTRQQGVFLILPIFWEFWESQQCNWRTSILQWKSWLSFSLLPLAMLGWIVYRAITLNDLHPDFSSLNSFVYSVIVSPAASKVVPEQVFLPPWNTIWLAAQKLFNAPDVDIIVNLTGGILFVILIILVWPHLRISYRIYSLAIILISFSYYTGDYHPTMGLLRHLMLAFPIYIGIPLLIRKSNMRLIATIFSAAGMLFLLTLYVLEAWVV